MGKLYEFPNATIYGERELGGMGLIYLLPYSAEACGFPALSSQSVNNLAEEFGGPLGAVTVLGAATYGAVRLVGAKGIKSENDTEIEDIPKE